MRMVNGSKPSHMHSVPSLIVFDLDNTLWTPELYQLRTIARQNKIPIAHKDVKLFDGAHKVIRQIKSDPKFANTKFAVASRTKSVDWAHSLLTQFELRDVFDYVEIFPGNKEQHFNNLRRDSGIDFHEMLFFDDARDGKYGNCLPVASLGVLSVHTPNGLYEESIWHNALDHYKEWSTTHRSPGTIVEWDNSITIGQPVDLSKRHKGSVKFINREKRFGFIKHEEFGKKDTFFHFNDLPSGAVVEEGDELVFSVAWGRNGKISASNIEVQNQGLIDNDLVEFRTFSMNLPFAALLANGYKTIESRNGTMFSPYPAGTKMLLHVGQRLYPDGDRHIEVMKSGGLTDQEINDLKALPSGFTKGMAVAIVEIGKTYETTLEQRCDPDYQRSVAAFGQDSGIRATEIKRVAYLKQGVKVSGQGGVFKVKVPKSVIPHGWLDETNSSESSNDKGYYYSATF